MRGGFLNTQQTLLNLSGNTAAISTIQTGSTIVGINISDFRKEPKESTIKKPLKIISE